MIEIVFIISFEIQSHIVSQLVCISFPTRVVHLNVMRRTVLHYTVIQCHVQNVQSQNSGFPGGLVVKTPPFSARGTGLIPGQGAKILHALQPKNQNIGVGIHVSFLNCVFLRVYA